MNQGKVAIVAMLGVGLVLSGFGWWVRYQRSQQVLAVWGTEAVIAIRTGDFVEVIPTKSLPSPPAESDALTVATEGYRTQSVALGEPIDITDAPGLIHARHHLVHEKGFDWEAPRKEGCVPDWNVAIRFKKEDTSATFLLDFACNRVYLVERKTEIGMRPIIADALNRFLQDFPFDTAQNSFAIDDADSEANPVNTQ